MIKYIEKSELEKHIIREGCDEGCGYIDERDLKNMRYSSLQRQELS